MVVDALTEGIIAAGIEVHRALGPGLLESAYEECLCHELALRAISHERQVVVPLRYKWLELPCAYRLYILVEERVIVEVKAVEALLPVHSAQLYTYLAITGLETGLLINFQTARLVDGIRRLSKKPKKSLCDLPISHLP